jgi:hypothetical protein
MLSGYLKGANMMISKTVLKSELNKMLAALTLAGIPPKLENGNYKLIINNNVVFKALKPMNNKWLVKYESDLFV